MRVNEIFVSIQGEGTSTGYPTIFVRFTGCNLRCSYCDTTYSYDEGIEMTAEDIYSKVKEYKYKRVCITGGEPLLQEEIHKLLFLLKEYEVNIETNGSIDISEFDLCDRHRFTMDMKTPSSFECMKMKLDNFKYLRRIDEIKFVIGSREDYEWAKKIIGNCYQRGIIIYSSVFTKIDPREIIGWILEDRLDVRFQLQIHKFIWSPEEKGV
ncbi:7-carboxy-7-deazaguanine synthase QueE [Wukongibacter sp. M2B1]|uniref:7-carboxy-7-deazaguanine synthase QueE n=1 Tax=Wukongibacter sp. M2B1 TaxID=3088895 RepID=UPI003D7A9584